MTALRGSEEGNRYSATGYEVRTYSGVMIDVRAPLPEQIRLDDVARSLAAAVRFGGNNPLQPTIAQHSLAVSYIAGELMPDEWAPDLDPEACRRRLKLAALMHDAPEFIVTDLVGAVKSYIRPVTHAGLRRRGARSRFDDLEARAMVAVEARFDCAVAEDWYGLIHEADCMACAYEMAHGGWAPDADPPRWVATDPYIEHCYGRRPYTQTDGGYAAFRRQARILGAEPDA